MLEQHDKERAAIANKHNYLDGSLSANDSKSSISTDHSSSSNSSRSKSPPQDLHYLSGSSNSSSPDRSLDISSDSSSSSIQRERTYSRSPEYWNPHVRESSSPVDQPLSLVVQPKGKVLNLILSCDQIHIFLIVNVLFPIFFLCNNPKLKF